MIRAIEQGIITDSTKSRLTELETELELLDIEIEKEKNHNYSYLTVEQIEEYLRTEVFESPTDIEVRKLLVNTFVREVLLYEDRIVLNYNFIEEFPDPKKSKEKLQKIADEISKTEPSFFPDRSSKQSTCLPPKRSKANALDLFYLTRDERHVGGFDKKTYRTGRYADTIKPAPALLKEYLLFASRIFFFCTLHSMRCGREMCGAGAHKSF